MGRKKGSKNGQQAEQTGQEVSESTPASDEVAAVTLEEIPPGAAVETETEPVGDSDVEPVAEEGMTLSDEATDEPTGTQPAAVEAPADPDGESSDGGVAAALADHADPNGEAPSGEVAAVEEPIAETADTEPGAEADKEITTEHVVEAILFASETPLSPQKLVSILGTGSVREIRKIVQTLNKTYARSGHAFRIEEIAGGYQLLTLPEYNTWLRRLKQSRQESKLSPAAMETLAVVAYKQPVVRVEIEAIRGVSVGETLNRLRELGLVKIVGRAEDVGRPMLYGTTRHFLEVFGLSSLEDLPAVEELQPPQAE